MSKDKGMNDNAQAAEAATGQGGARGDVISLNGETRAKFVLFAVPPHERADGGPVMRGLLETDQGKVSVAGWKVRCLAGMRSRRDTTRADLDMAIDWAAAEGWNPGLHDADTFHAADPGGFLLGLLEAEPVAMISAVRYGAHFGFIGFYIVRPEFRGQGHGIALWRAAMKRLAGRTIGLDGWWRNRPAIARADSSSPGTTCAMRVSRAAARGPIRRSCGSVRWGRQHPSFSNTTRPSSRTIGVDSCGTGRHRPGARPWRYELQSFRPARDDTVERERGGLVALVGAVELPPVGKGASIVDLDRIGGGRGSPRAFLEAAENEAAGGDPRTGLCSVAS